MSNIQQLLSCFPQSPIYKSYKSTANRAKYAKIFQTLYERLQTENIFDIDNDDELFKMYMSKPRIIIQGIKSLDLRANTDEFKRTFLSWAAQYRDLDVDLINDYSSPEITNEPDMIKKALGENGITMKQLKQVAKNKNRLPKEELKKLEEFVELISALPPAESSNSLQSIVQLLKKNK